MIRALYTAASGMSAQQMNLDTIANNLANSSTTGFRQLRLQFQDMVYQNLVTPGAAQSQSTVSAGLQIGLGTKSAATEVIMTQGSLNQTSNPLDVAIEGRGILSGAAAGRDHRLHARRAVSPEQPGNHRDHRRRSADSDHHHSAQCDGGDDYPVRRGERDPARAAESVAAGAACNWPHFPIPAAWKAWARICCRPRSAPATRCWAIPGGTEGLGTLQQGYLENSNVDVVTEFVQMVLAQRAYESNSKVIKAADDMYSQVNNMTR